MFFSFILILQETMWKIQTYMEGSVGLDWVLLFRIGISAGLLRTR
jgi:hypothetical protein